MKKLRANMDKWFEQLDRHWKALPLQKQRKYTVYFFTVYVILTAGVIFKVWYDLAKSENKIVIKHIENPVHKKKESPALQDTLITILKNKMYERK